MGEAEYTDLDTIVGDLTGMLNTIYRREIPLETVKARVQEILMIQGVVPIEVGGPLPMLVLQCSDECRADLTGRN